MVFHGLLEGVDCVFASEIFCDDFAIRSDDPDGGDGSDVIVFGGFGVFPFTEVD